METRPLRAILTATAFDGPRAASGETNPLPLVPILDRPFVQHVVEHLIRCEIRTVDIILSHDPDKFESLLGDGHRWGAVFRYHLARDPGSVYRIVRRLAEREAAEGKGPILLGDASVLPDVDLGEACPSSERRAPVVYVQTPESSPEAGERRGP